jgi:hypothetical protein
METELRKNGMILLPVDRKAFREAVLRNSRPADINQTQEDYERLSALASRKPAPSAPTAAAGENAPGKHAKKPAAAI